jgi:hypothetical protein
MAKSFSKSFKKLSAVLTDLQIQHKTQVPFVITEQMKISPAFKGELEFVFHRVPYNTSEFSICENLIYPTIKEVWKLYADIFNVWSRALVQLNLNIKGYPDYLIAKRSPLSNVIFDVPYMAVVEAKKDDFSGAWGQCLVEMHTIQQLNGNPEFPVYGITSSGLVWQFGKLEGNVFTEFETLFLIQNADELLSALKTLFEICKQNATKFGYLKP